MAAGNIITVKTRDFEKSGTLLKVISKCVDYKKKFRITIEYDPEFPNTKIRYEEITSE